MSLIYTGIAAQCWKAVSSKKLSPSTATEMHYLSCCGCFSRGLLAGGVLFICVWRASACSPSRELCCLDGETGHRACTKNPFWYCHWYIQELRPNAEKPFPLKSCRLLLRLKCIISHVVGVFHVVYCDDKKKNKMQFWICHERRLHRYTNQITFLLLSLTDFIQLAINIITSYMAKNIRRHNGCTSYIYC